jgi:hypothetical protein
VTLGDAVGDEDEPLARAQLAFGDAKRRLGAACEKRDVSD